MNKVIKGKRYDTETATEILTYDSEYSVTDFNYFSETLYQKRTGEYFLYGEGGPMSNYAVSCGQNEWCGGEKIIPYSIAQAKAWVEKHFDADTYEKIFGNIEEGKTQVCISLDKSTLAQLKKLASAKSMTASELVSRLIEHYGATPQGEDYLA